MFWRVVPFVLFGASALLNLVALRQERQQDPVSGHQEFTPLGRLMCSAAVACAVVGLVLLLITAFSG